MNRAINAELKDVQEGKYTFTASTSTKDRHGTVLNMEGWDLEKFNINPIIGYQHELYGAPCEKSDPDDVIGTGRAYVQEARVNGERELMLEVMEATFSSTLQLILMTLQPDVIS